MKKTAKMITADDAELSLFDTDVSKYLVDDKVIADYLNYILENGDEIDFKRALNNIAKAKGVITKNVDIFQVLKGFRITSISA
jgi:DNA-binding phage protein